VAGPCLSPNSRVRSSLSVLPAQGSGDRRGPLAHNFPFDALQIPLNCLEAGFRSCETQVLPEANRRGIAALSAGRQDGGGEMVHHGAFAAENWATRESARGYNDQRERVDQSAKA
jgi:hypothetical protein